jgi:hypothetical protein
MEESAADGRIFFPEDFWDDLPGNGIVHFLFEATSAGKGELVFSLQANTAGLPQDIDMSMSGVWFDLKNITDMYQHFTVGDSIDVFPSSSANELNGVSKTDLDEMELEEDYILFVHGWRMYPWERRAFAETSFKRLYWQGYKGRFGMFSWPTEWAPRVWWFGGNPDPTDPQNYTRSERKARLSGEGLESLLNTLNGQYSSRLHMFAHSMGNVVASEGLRLHGSGELVSTFIACQSASTAHSYDGVNPEVIETDSSTQTPEVYRDYPVGNQPYYGQIGSAAGTIINFHNRQDDALSGWSIGQDLKPDYGWYYDDGDSWWYRDDSTFPVPDTALFFPGDRYEIFAHIAEARSRALGAAVHGQFTVAGSVDDSFDLNTGFSSAEFNYSDTAEDHSAQFRSTNMRRSEFYRTLLDYMGL